MSSVPPEVLATVLLIDDCEEQNDLIHRHLEPYGIRVEWRTSYRSAVDALQDPDVGPLVDLVLIDQAFDTETVVAGDLLTADDIEASTGTANWDVRLHQGLYILARMSEDMRAGRIPLTRLILLTSHARPPIAATGGAFAGHMTKRSLIADAYRSLRAHLKHMRPEADGIDRRLAARTGHRDRVLVTLGPGVPMSWDGPILNATEAGPLCAEGPIALTIWAPSQTWARAFALLAMCKSARPEESLVLTDEPVPLDLVPADGRIAVVQAEAPSEVRAGAASFSCRHLRDDELFRSLLTTWAPGRSNLEPVLWLHAFSGSPHGCEVLGRWGSALSSLLTEGRPDLPGHLRAELEGLADAAERAERASAGGFHGLDPVVRGAKEWEATARTYLRLAAAASPSASRVVERWLTATAGWHLAPRRRQEALRTAAATALHRLVDDPWLGDERSGRLFSPVRGEAP